MEYIVREDYLKQIRRLYHSDLIKVISGMRRSGKSVLMGQIEQELRKEAAPEDRFLTVNFELYKNRHLLHPDQLYSWIEEELSKSKGRTVFFFDEIQTVDQWESVVQSLRLEENVDIYITGSNSQLLSSELATKLAGRTVSFTVYPLSFWEFCQLLKLNGGEAGTEQMFQQYVQYGGMPYLQKIEYEQEAALLYLSDLYHNVLLQDIAARYQVRDINLLKRILEFVMANPGNPISTHSIVKYLKNEGTATSVSTVSNYLEFAEAAYLFLPARRFDLSGKKYLQRTEKFYLVDQGIREAVIRSNQKDIQMILENIVFMELKRRGNKVSVGIQNNREVDFIAENLKHEISYYQVSYLLASDDTINREFLSLSQIRDDWPKFVLSMDKFDFSRDGIRHRNLVDWLLDRSWTS